MRIPKKWAWLYYTVLSSVSIATTLFWSYHNDWAKKHMPPKMATALGVETIEVIGPDVHQEFKTGQPLQMQLFVRGGRAPYYWFVLTGEMPPGIELDPQTGYIHGMMQGVPGTTYTFRIAVRDADGRIGIAQ